MEDHTLVKKIAIVGPESTGKSTLTQALATHYNTVWVPEYARRYLNQLHVPYNQKDLTKIAYGQLALEEEYLNSANRFLFCDTNLIVIKVWSEFKFGNCDQEILVQMMNRKYDLHLLTYIDLPWKPDPLREHPDKRKELFECYEAALREQNLQYSIIRGEEEQRIESAIQAVELYLT